MKILKFGGKSLTSGNQFEPVINIIKSKINEKTLVVVVSALGDTTNILEELLDFAATKLPYESLFSNLKNRFKNYSALLSSEFEFLSTVLKGVSLTGDYSSKIKDSVLAQGEIITSKIVTHQLIKNGVNATSIDSRQFLITDYSYGNALPDEVVSKLKTQTYFNKIKPGIVPIVTGFIGATPTGETVTLGRNGSNYSAALLANYLHAEELENYTHVNGIFTANPDWVKNAQKIEELNYEEANELAKFGASILHPKTIFPLVQQKISLRILNTLNPFGKGTLISAKPTKNGLKSLTVDQEAALIQLNGRGLLGIPGIDARIFTSLAQHQISVGIISQGASERGVGFLVPVQEAEKTKIILESEFKKEFSTGDVHQISIKKNIAVLSIIGQDLSDFDKAYAALVKNKIIPILFNNTVTGKNVSLVVQAQQAKKAVNVIHGHIFGIEKKVNLAVFGHGLVGGTLIDQILESVESIAKKKNIRFHIFAIANSKKGIFNADGIQKGWQEKIENEGHSYNLQDILNFAEKHHLENLIAIDNTASTTLIDSYIPLVENGFDLISSNKIANTISIDFYKKLRKTLKANHKEYLYETNVGAGLPLIDTIKLLHLSGENIIKIRGVFSGSLSYIFNTFSESDLLFSEVLQQADLKGFTEPDPREDLSGNDVARKLLILARELDLENKFEEIDIHNLIPEQLREIGLPDFLNAKYSLNEFYQQQKNDLDDQSVLRYIGELSGDLQQKKGILKTSLISVPKSTALGQLTGSDSLFEIYTESYGENPISICGAGAGASVTARGVFGDILRLVSKL